MKWKDAIKLNYTFIFRGYIDNDGEYVVIATSPDKTEIQFYKGDNAIRRYTMPVEKYEVEKYSDWLPHKSFDIGSHIPDEQMVKLCYFKYKKLLKECKI